ncbi:unnamed protein product [Clonostachys chloroleuca]|uniref:Uncharacterized protein n=1 Tax=Clonostachys chloroleuca TaxID=1926264 RepID=A0AA35M4W0_9HYPO|nr:unnamed protein product [Clonostachys chloroleuca]
MGLKKGVKEKEKALEEYEEASGALEVQSTDSNIKPGKINLVHIEDIQNPDEKRKKENIKKKKRKNRKNAFARFRKHMVKYWLCYAILIIVLLAIGLPVLFLKIIPALAQRIIDDTDLPIYSATLKALTNDSVLIGLRTALDVPLGLTVGLDPVELWLYNADSEGFNPYTMVRLDEQKVKGHTEISVHDNTVGVSDRDELDKWLTGMLNNKEAEISVKGNTTAHLGALHFGVNLKKTVKVKALNRLDGFGLVSARIKIPPAEDGSNLLGNMILPNWSDLTIGLGNLTFNVWAGQLLIGQVSAFDVLLPPGNSTLPFRGQVFLETFLKNLPAVIGSQAASLGSGAIELGLNGNSTVVNGNHIGYLEKVLNAARFTSQVPLLQLLSDMMQSVASGDTDLGGLLDLIGEGLDSLLNGLRGGNSTSDSGGGAFSDILKGLNETWFGDGNSKRDLREIVVSKLQR